MMAEMEEPVLFSKNFKVCLKSAEFSLILLIFRHCLRTSVPLRKIQLRIFDLLEEFVFTHTDRLPDQPSYNPTSHKATTIRTLTRRAQLVCDSPDSLQDETDYLYNVFSKNNYNTDFVRRNTHSNTDSNTQTNVNSGPVTTATLPYIRI